MSVLGEAPTLAEAGKWKELHTLMSQLVKEQPDNQEVLWWHARACFDYGSELPSSEKKKVFEEGLQSAETCRTKYPSCAEAYKYNAILLSKIGDLSGTKEKVGNANVIREYAEKAGELAPEDSVVQHILGAWHYNIANISWAQRQAAKLLFGTPPSSTFEAALPYLEKARELRPDFHQNLVILGHVYVQLKRPADAKKAFEAVLSLPAPSAKELEAAAEAKASLKKL